MVHIVAPTPSRESLPVFFNVDAVVGAAPAQNLPEDVMFVQYCFRFGANRPQTVPPDVLPFFQQVKVTGQCDAATIAAIRRTQEGFKKTKPAMIADGRVSPARGYDYGAAVYTIVNYNNIVQNRCLDVWPRIDLLSDFPPQLRPTIRRILIGTAPPG